MPRGPLVIVATRRRWLLTSNWEIIRPWRLGKNRDRNHLARRYRRDIEYYTDEKLQIVTIMRRGRNMPRRLSTILPRNAWQLTFRNAGGELRSKLPQLM